MAKGQADAQRAGDELYQRDILQGVSRTFALTIPQLPGPLATVVGNGYLLCRIADTIEDDADLDAQRKRHFSECFVAALEGRLPATDFVAGLLPALSPKTPAAERDLIANTARVVRLTHGFTSPQRQALVRCVRIMSRGMAEFQQHATLGGLADLAELDRYCYHVAGVVGEMLTELFCDYSPRVAEHREMLMRLAVSFGQGLQMTNILKDVWEDRRRGACWLPRAVFAGQGLDLDRLSPEAHDPAFPRGMETLVGIARAHLANALRYTLLLPADEQGMRRFCLWALGMAVLTLRKIHAHLDFTDGQQVKISRRSVRATVLVTNLAVSSDTALRFLFGAFTRGLPRFEDHVAAVST